MKNPYSVLGVPRGASTRELKKAYRSRARELHPDFTKDDGKKMQELNAAYDEALDPSPEPNPYDAWSYYWVRPNVRCPTRYEADGAYPGFVRKS